MKCLNCGTDNPATNTYCGQCGNIITLSDSILDRKGSKTISDHLGDDFKVNKVIQTELTQVVLEKMITWLKLFGFFVGEVMKASQGKANPDQVNKILKQKLI